MGGWERPSSVGKMDPPSIETSCLTPAASQIVGNMSLDMATRSDCEPADFFRPSGMHRDTHAAFEHVLLVPGKWSVVGPKLMGTTIVAGENHQGVLGTACRLECLDHLAGTVFHMFDQCS